MGGGTASSFGWRIRGDAGNFSKCLGVATLALVIRGPYILPQLISATEPPETFLFSPSDSKHLAVH